MRVIYEIVGHTSRLDEVDRLVSHLGAEGVSSNIWIDNGFFGEWKNHVRALKHAAESDSEYAVILQDDAMPVNDFTEAVNDVIDNRPDSLISLYVGTSRPREQQVLDAVDLAERDRACWMKANTLLWGVGIIVPVPLISPLLAEAQSGPKLPYDQRLGRANGVLGRDVYYTWPSLVDHHDIPTVVAGHSRVQPVRVAHRVGHPNFREDAPVIEIGDPLILDQPNGVLPSKRDRVY